MDNQSPLITPNQTPSQPDSTPVAPSALPGYIYDEDPDFFGTHYGVSRF